MSAEALKALLDAARELLALRAMKHRLDAEAGVGSDAGTVGAEREARRQAVADYERRKPLAWEALSAAVEQIDAQGTVW